MLANSENPAIAGVRVDKAPIRTAVIGFGSSGRYFHAPFLEANPYFSLDAVVTASREPAGGPGVLSPRDDMEHGR